ncbi:MAG: tRNA-specific adenosine deaminase [Desulfobulbus propionicus]|nr:MAG: tRNA-specific adenosine deaminase [Desulfobulbus propionicus]
MEEPARCHEQFMAVALQEARQALEEGEFPVGCVLVNNKSILGRGRRCNSGSGSRNEIDHAEAVALHQLIRHQPNLDLSTVSVYCTLEPCLMCYSTLLLSGIRTFVWAYEDVMGGGINLPLHMLNPLYQNMETVLVGGVCRQESLALFQQFFQKYSYWQESLLARYTLAQP